jgi:hypothetical protein
MLTLYLRYTLDPNKRAAYEAYVAAEMEPITRSGGKIIGYFLPTDYAGPTNEAHGLIEFPSLAIYEQYRTLWPRMPLTRRTTPNSRGVERSFPSCVQSCSAPNAEYSVRPD